jgi:hypothetical protein
MGKAAVGARMKGPPRNHASTEIYFYQSVIRRAATTFGVLNVAENTMERRAALIILGMPFGPGSAHVVQFGPIWTEARYQH